MDLRRGDEDRSEVSGLEAVSYHMREREVNKTALLERPIRAPLPISDLRVFVITSIFVEPDTTTEYNYRIIFSYSFEATILKLSE